VTGATIGGAYGYPDPTAHQARGTNYKPISVSAGAIVIAQFSSLGVNEVHDDCSAIMGKFPILSSYKHFFWCFAGGFTASKTPKR